MYLYSVYFLIQLSVQFHAHWVMNQTHLVNVFQCISVSPRIPVRMEQHVILVLITTLTTPAHVLPTTQDRIVTVSKHNNYVFP